MKKTACKPVIKENDPVTSVTIKIRPSADKIWKIGEKVDFTSCVFDQNGKKLRSGTYVLHITNSGGKELCRPLRVNAARNNPFTFSAQLDEPGFLMAESFGYTNAAGKRLKWSNVPATDPPRCGVPVEPEKIRPGLPKPDDFDRFWQSGIESFKDAPVTVVPEKEIKLRGYRVNRITVEFPDKSGAIDGFLSIPVKPGKYPMIFFVPGAGAGTTGPVPYYTSGKRAIYLSMNVHKFPTASTPEEQKKRFDRYNKSFPDKQIYIKSQVYDRDKYIFRNVFLALNRAVDHAVANVKEYDQKHLACVGSSQGGMAALAISSLNKNVTSTVVNVPAFCDCSGDVAGRLAGGENLLKRLKKRADESIRYFDGANFACKIKSSMLIAASFGDITSPAASVYAVYNTSQGRKQMHHIPYCGHIMTKDFILKAAEFLCEEFAN